MRYMYKLEPLSENILDNIISKVSFAHGSGSDISRLLLKKYHDIKIDDVTCYLPINADLNMLIRLIKILDNLVINFHRKTRQQSKRLIFTDMGSGTGNIFALAGAIGYDARGFEYHQPLVDYSNIIAVRQAYTLGWITNRNSTTSLHNPVVQGNLLKEEDIKKHLPDKDVIYSWNPIIHSESMMTVLRWIVKYMKPGATFIYNPAHVSLYNVLNENEICSNTGFEIYKKPVAKCKSK